jgi:hypothetical protein
MQKTTFFFHQGRIFRLFTLVGCLLLVFVVLPSATKAGPPVGAETCAECHVEETEAWQVSPHANAVDDQAHQLGATCEDCHGPYVEDHPEAGLMQLTMDSSVCVDCHTQTFGQWENSMHAQADVQCIGCHLSHSQEARLTDQTLCASCHRSRVDTAHTQAGVDCIECHLSSAAATNVSFNRTGQEAITEIAAASHDFTSVLAQDCLNCHGEEVHQNVSPEILAVSAVNRSECDESLAARLDEAKQTNRSLATMAPVSLGLGLGIGAMLGIIIMLVVGYINQRVTKP